MPTSRLEAFSDGVLAIVITIMVLELRVPSDASLAALGKSAGLGFLSYLLSFVYIGIYWTNHHHIFQVVERVSGLVLWANLHLLFWLSLFPFTTTWLDKTGLAQTPTVLYGMNLLLAGVAYNALVRAIFYTEGAGSQLRKALGQDLKGKISPLLCILGIGLAFVATWLSMVSYAVLAVIWLVPDRRVERFLAEQERGRL